MNRDKRIYLIRAALDGVGALWFAFLAILLASFLGILAFVAMGPSIIFVVGFFENLLKAEDVR